MNQYMIDIDLPEQPDEEFFNMIPLQRDHIDTLLSDGIIASYSLSLDRAKLWVVLMAQDIDEVRQVLNDFPMVRYFVYSVHELAFHNRSQVVPTFSLN
jgi:hypothetical protein